MTQPLAKNAPVQRISRTDRFNELKDSLAGSTSSLMSALPPSIPVEMFKSVLLTAVQNNPEILECDVRSIWSAAKRAAFDGLLPDGREGAIVVRWMKGGSKSAGWQPMIAGIRKKVRTSGEVDSFWAQVVYENDHFDYALGDEPYIVHKPQIGSNRGRMIAAYAIATLKSGEKIREVMAADEIYAIRDKFSDGWKAYKDGKIRSTPWSSSEGEMAKKTVALRLAKVLPMSTDIREALTGDDDTVGDTPQQRPRLADFSEQPKQIESDSAVAMDDISGPEPEMVEALAAGTTTRSKSAPAEEKTSAAQPDLRTSYPVMVEGWKQRLRKYPRHVQNEIWDTEIDPRKDLILPADLDDLRELMKDE
jgi:recombination protein RecT